MFLRTEILLELREVISRVAEDFINYDVEKNREGFVNIISFIQSQIDSFGGSYDKFQDSILMLRVRDSYFGDEVSTTDFSEKQTALEEKLRDIQYDISLMKTFKIMLSRNKEYTNLPSLKFKVTELSFDEEIAAETPCSKTEI